MKIALAQLNYHIGNFEENTRKIKASIARAKEAGADLVVFAELALCGYPPRDFLEWEEFLDRCEEAVKDIAQDCLGIACILGAPARNEAPEGKNLYNSAFFLEEGRIGARVDKSLLPTYDVFDEYRYFEHNRRHEVIGYKGTKIALSICEDLWNSDEDPLYVSSPMDQLILQEPGLMINIAASPFDYGHREERLEVLRSNCLKYKLPLLYVNHVGSQTELIFDGGSMALDREGRLIDEMAYFKEDFRLYEMLDDGRLHSLANRTGNAGKTPASQQGASSEDAPARVAAKEDLPEREAGDSRHSWEWRHGEAAISRIHQALLLGIRDYFRKSGFDKAILGLSGGIDSALVLVLACQALGRDNVLPVLMPSTFSSGHSVSDSLDLVERLGCRHELIPIEHVYEAFLKSLEPQFKGLPFGLAEENLQARIRGTLLMSLSNKLGYILLNTSNKSENAVGYGTLYGDMCGGLSVIGDVYKMQVYALARYLNRHEEIIPRNILVKAPSAELRPGQKDSDSLPEYELLDRVLYQYIELKKTTEQIVEKGLDPAIVSRVIRMVNTNEYKRYQVPPILRVSPKAFGMGRRMPIVGKFLS